MIIVKAVIYQLLITKQFVRHIMKIGTQYG
jgi:hypothetical protein